MRRIFFDPPKPKIQKKKAIVKQNEIDFEKEIRTVLEVEGMPVFPGKILNRDDFKFKAVVPDIRCSREIMFDENSGVGRKDCQRAR